MNIDIYIYLTNVGACIKDQNISTTPRNQRFFTPHSFIFFHLPLLVLKIITAIIYKNRKKKNVKTSAN